MLLQAMAIASQIQQYCGGQAFSTRASMAGDSSSSYFSYAGTHKWSLSAASASELWGSRGRLSAGIIVRLEQIPGRNGAQVVQAKGFNFWEVLGGRGLVGGEKLVNTEQGLKQLFTEPAASKKSKEKKDSGDDKVEVTGVDGFEKELSGLVGGFPGGEKGLGIFLQKYPPPGKETRASRELAMLRGAFTRPAAIAKSFAPPLLMPGMNVIVKEPTNPYHNFTGIVQRITDGRVGVLFEGGNWDKLITFELTELERTAGGPPMVHPKSAILLQQDIP